MKIAFRYCHCLFLAVVLTFCAEAQLTNVQGRCGQQAQTANVCIQANVANPVHCSLCVMDFMNNTMMNGFASMMGSNTHMMMRSSSSSLCHQMQGQACSAMGSCGCSACSYEMESYMDCGINATAQSLGSACSGRSRKLQYSYGNGGGGMCSRAKAKDTLFACAIATFAVIISI